MNQLSIVDSGVIFRNPLPGHRVINAIYPFIQPMPDGELLCVLRVGSALYSPDGMVEVFRSRDAGQTWLRQGPIRNRAADAKPYNYAEGILTLLRDGSLLMRLMRVDVTNPDLLAYNEKTQGMRPFEVSFLRSSNGGRTWSEPVNADIASHFPKQEPAAYGPVVELADGTWFQPFETWKQYEDGGPFDLHSYGMFSKDGGRTWGGKARIVETPTRDRSYSHGNATRLRDGRLFISFWTAESQLQKSFDLHTVTSTDATARRWTEPKSTGIPGQTSCATDLGNGRMLIIYSHRENTQQPGIKVVLSFDGGQTWNLDPPLTVWDAYGKESLGVARTDKYPSSHDAIAYGAPKIIAIDGQHAIASYWCTQGADTHCRWCRVFVS